MIRLIIASHLVRLALWIMPRNLNGRTDIILGMCRAFAQMIREKEA